MFNFTTIDSKLDKQTSLYGKFSILPIKKGNAITIGNALRRILLSNLPGIAITAVKIKGVESEFSTVIGIREDILEILLNLKQIIFKGNLLRKTIVNLIKDGPTIVTAGDIQLPDYLQIINPEHYIATISSSIVLNLELQISSGVGYKSANSGVKENSFDFIEMDAIFMPVTKVNYYVENIYIEPLLVRENLIIEIWTNGSILPKKALKKSSEILIHLFSTFIEEPKLPNLFEYSKFPVFDLIDSENDLGTYGDHYGIFSKKKKIITNYII